MKALFQAGPGGRVPVPPEKRFLITLSLFALCGACLAANVPSAAAPSSNAMAVNTWTRMVDGGTGPQGGAGLVYAPSLDRFVLHAGAVYAPEEAPFPYDVLSFKPGETTWRNEFPAGRNWGPEYGVAKPPDMKCTYPTYAPPIDKEGTCRPHRRAVRSMTFAYVVDPDADGMWAIVHGRTMFHAFKDMTWQDFGDAGGAGAGSGRPLHFGALAYDPVNKEVIEFGGL